MAKVSWAWRASRPRDTGDEQRRCIEDGGEGAEPALVVVLGAEVAEQRIGDVAFEEFGGPALPLDKESGKSDGGALREWRRMSSAAVGGEPARASRSAMLTSRRENAP